MPAATARSASPAWGITMKSLLGEAKGKTLADRRRARPHHRRRARRRVVAGRAHGAGPGPGHAVTPVVDHRSGPGPGRSRRRGAARRRRDHRRARAVAAALPYTGTVATTQAFYRPENPALAGGLTVLLPYAPPEQATAANKVLAADVERFAPGTKLTANVIAGYWAADEFVAALTKAGKGATAAKLAKTLRTFTYTVKDTVGPTTFPGAHAQPSPCGALVQSDGTGYLPAVTYRCGNPVKVKPAATTSTTTTTTAAAPTTTVKK
ncbi:MAG: ABC transporter substrate-binding protein [Acidimicrobiia bacterium]